MSFETPKDFQKYAQDCVKLAQQPNTDVTAGPQAAATAAHR
jgi:uncharacterized protein (DUF2345 family)